MSVDGEDPIADPEDYVQRRRLQEIHDARERVLEARRDANELLYLSDELDVNGRNTLLRNAVEEYILEIEAQLKSRQEETSNDYWEEYPLGVCRAGDSGHQWHFRGLESIIEAPEFLHHEWKEAEDDTVQGRRYVDRQWTGQIPQNVLMNGFRAVNAFLDDIDMDLKTDDGIPVTQL